MRRYSKEEKDDKFLNTKRKASDSEDRKDSSKNSDSESQKDENKSTEEKTKLFIRNLSYKTKEDELQNFFEKFGKIKSVLILSHNGRSKGMGFVEFEDNESAKKALKEEDLELDGRKLGLSWADDRKRNERERHSNIEKTKIIFVGNLSYNSTESSIEEFFSDCGKIENIRIAKNQDGKMKGFCHVAFEDEEAVDKALEKNNEELDGRNIRVDKALPRTEGGRDHRDHRGGRGRGRGGFRGGRRDRRDRD